MEFVPGRSLSCDGLAVMTSVPVTIGILGQKGRPEDARRPEDDHRPENDHRPGDVRPSQGNLW